MQLRRVHSFEVIILMASHENHPFAYFQMFMYYTPRTLVKVSISSKIIIKPCHMKRGRWIFFISLVAHFLLCKKTKSMTSDLGIDVIRNPGDFPCTVFHSGVGVSSILCTQRTMCMQQDPGWTLHPTPNMSASVALERPIQLSVANSLKWTNRKPIQAFRIE